RPRSPRPPRTGSAGGRRSAASPWERFSWQGGTVFPVQRPGTPLFGCVGSCLSSLSCGECDDGARILALRLRSPVAGTEFGERLAQQARKLLGIECGRRLAHARERRLELLRGHRTGLGLEDLRVHRRTVPFVGVEQGFVEFLPG